MGQTIFNCGLGLLGAAVLLLLIFAIRRPKYDASKMAADDDDDLEVTIPGQEDTVRLKKAPKPVKVLREGIDYEDDEDWPVAGDDSDDADDAPVTEPDAADVVPEEDGAVKNAEDASQPEAPDPAAEESELSPDGTVDAGAESAAEPMQGEGEETQNDDVVTKTTDEVAEADNSGAEDPDFKEGVVSE